MIVCQACGKENPLGTRFCRGCGEKIIVTVTQIKASVNRTRTEDATGKIRMYAANSLSLALFLFICAMLVRFTATPAVPTPDLPPVSVGRLVPDSEPGRPAAVAQAKPASGAAWRSRAAPRVRAECGTDVARIDILRRAIVAAQSTEGQWPGDNPFAATGLAVLALQCTPGDPVADAAAARGRDWLAARTTTFDSQPAIAKTLAFTALLDAGQIDRRMMRGTPWLADGSAGRWQSLLVAMLPSDERPADLSGLAKVLPAPHLPWLDLAKAKPATTDPALLGQLLTAAATGEDRFLSALNAWHLGVDPAVVLTAVNGWAATDPAPAGVGLASAGPTAAPACALLAAHVALVLPPLWSK
jgi:hypothetical protein